MFWCIKITKIVKNPNLFSGTHVHIRFVTCWLYSWLNQRIDNCDVRWLRRVQRRARESDIQWRFWAWFGYWLLFSSIFCYFHVGKCVWLFQDKTHVTRRTGKVDGGETGSTDQVLCDIVLCIHKSDGSG